MRAKALRGFDMNEAMLCYFMTSSSVTRETNLPSLASIPYALSATAL